MPKNGQFEYPTSDWATGNMRMAKRGMPIGDPGYPIRELEGERKRKETKVSATDDIRGKIRDSIQNGSSVTLNPDHFDIFHDEYTKFKGANGAKSS